MKVSSQEGESFSLLSKEASRKRLSFFTSVLIEPDRALTASKIFHLFIHQLGFS
jgi:hypothetical protein